MTLQTLARAIKTKKPAVIKEGGTPRYVVLDWAAYRKLQALQEDFEDNLRFELSERVSRGKRRYSLQEAKKRLGLR